jgi:hypothetical protein
MMKGISFFQVMRVDRNTTFDLARALKIIMVDDGSVEPPPSDRNYSGASSLVNPPPPRLRLFHTRRRGNNNGNDNHAISCSLIAALVLYLCGCAMVGIVIGFAVAYCGLGKRCFG